MSSILPTVDSQMSLRARMDGFRRDRKRVAYVPTMGALHDGHLSLVRIAKRVADVVVVSIFVNPTQFAPDEDFDSYPRDFQADLELLADAGVDLVYLPKTDSMYFDDHSTQVIVGQVGEGLETNHRPTFFHGVALVVAKLLNRLRPDIAVFGEKDYQQLAVIRRMTRDLDINVEIIGAPIARDKQGLALSSRNRYFDEAGLATARQFNAVLKDCVTQLESGADVAKALSHARQSILDAGFSSVDYVSLCDATSLQPVTTRDAPARLLAAVHCHGVRLIDNFAVAPNSSASSSLKVPS